MVSVIGSLEVITKMGRAGVKNASQISNSLGLANIKSSTKALDALIRDRKNSLDFAYRAAATLHSYASELANFENGEAPDNFFLKTAAMLPKASKKMLTINGFQHTELFNRIYSSIIAREYALDTYKSYMEAAPGSRTQRMEKMRLEKMGQDVEALKEKGGPDQFDLRIASYKFVGDTQFVNNALSLPRWVTSESPWIRLMTLFKTFSYHQGKLVYRTMKSDPVKAATLMATMTAFGAGTATTVDFLTAKVRDEESIPEQLYRYISSAGGFGVYADTLQSSIRSSEGIASAIGGPFIGDVGRKVYALKQGLVEGNWDLMQREMRKDIPIIGTTVNNLVEQ
jgi:hypothetical protein